MYEVAPVAGNKFEAACALRSLQTIMGQISSNHNTSSRHHNNQKSKIYYRHSAVAPVRKEEMAILRDPLRDTTLYRGGGVRDSTVKKIKDLPNGRPVTISEMNAYNIEKNEASSKASDKEIIKTMEPVQKSDVPNEFYTVGDGYHKTETCYYRSPDGNFHKLPTDSYHKMSEGCYIKVADGSFRRLENNSSVASGDTGLGQTKVKNHMMRFLKRSKSHTPGTIKEMQKEKEREREREREQRKNRATAAGENNRKVVVTMMENGGLPIVATSKADRTKHTRDKDGSNKSRDNKVK